MSEALRVLVVDDEPDLRDIIGTELERAGLKTACAENAAAALALMKEQAFQIIVSDVRMPGGGAIELLEGLAPLKTQAPAVILVTGFSDIALEEAYHRGAEAVLTKPFNRGELVAAVKRAALPLAERWLGTEPLPPPRRQLEKRFSGLDQALSSRELLLGRGGLAFRVEGTPIYPGEIASVRIDFGSGGSAPISATTLVRWTREQDSSCGLEFLKLASESRESVLGLIARHAPRSYIPSK